MADLITTAEAEARLGARFASRPDLDELIASASAVVEDHCRRTFAYAAEVVEALNGPGSPVLLLGRPPVVSIASVVEDGITLDASDYVLGPDARTLYRGPGGSASGLAWPLGVVPGPPGLRGLPNWSDGRSNIVVTYAGGFSEIPAPVRTATAMMVRFLADATESSGFYRSEQVGSVSYQTDPNAGRIPRAVLTILAPYVLPNPSA